MSNKLKSRIRLGITVRLNSGSPDMLVVDFDWGNVVVAYKDEGIVHEAIYPYACLTIKD